MPGQFVIPPAYGPVCQIGLGDVRTAEPTSWLDVSCHVHEAETFRGRERFNDRFEPGTASVTFSNDDGWGDLVGAPITVADALLRPGRPIRIGVQGPFDGGTMTTRWLWRGWIDQAAPDYDPVVHDVVTVNCIDALGESGQTVAPAGAQQGVHEVASDRINRVLDAVGWFPAKRKVSTSTTLVQGTRLGSAAMDLMTVAADTAGGVVYGDLDGDVVYKDIDWMLYDPDVPPDGEIGNVDPGTPPLPDQPAYLDPRPGVVYDPDPAIPTHPDTIDVCLAAPPSQGTVIEQGDAWRIFTSGTPLHLWYESSGHLWDMGPWTAADRCTTIHDGGGGPPTRQDPGGPILPGTPSLFGFAVEFLGYSDAGIAEGPQSSVTVAGLHPGPDCMLVVLINALCLDPPGGSLVPFPDVGSGSVTAGSLVFERIDIRESTGLDGAESYAAACEIGRTDPGTISVVVDWSGTNQSRTHIVTVWKATRYRKDLFQRMRLGAYLHAGTHDVPTPPHPAGGPPGKGATAVPFASTDTAATAIIPFCRPTDITIAQSLAEEHTGPFGATFNDSDGAWITPAFAGAAVTAVEVVCDDFERADGPLGAAWVLGPAAAWADSVMPLSISGGAAIGTAQSDVEYVSNSMSWATPQSGDQSIEVTVENIWSGLSGQYIGLLTNMTAGSDESHYADFAFDPTGSIQINALHFHGPSVWDSLGSVNLSHAASEPIRLRLESKVDGTQLVFVDDVLALTAVDPAPAAGGLIGFSLDVRPGTSSPRVLEACIGGSGGIVRKCSWVAGYRSGVGASDVKWTEVNTGVDNIQSAQAEVVVESGADVGFTWRTLGYKVLAPISGSTVLAGSLAQTVRPERSGVIIVAVGAFAGSAVASGITVTSDRMTFTPVRTQATSGTGWAQGRLFAATLDNFPTDPASPPTITVAWSFNVEKIAWTIYEVANGGVIVGSGSSVAGNHTTASADGPSNVVLSSAPAVDDLTLGFLFGSVVSDGRTATATPGTGMTTELAVIPPKDQVAYIHVESRVASTSTDVPWADKDAEASSDAKDVVMFGVAIRPLAGFANWSTNDPLMIGGARDAFGGPIYSASGSNGGTPVWNFDPALPGAGAI